MLEWPADRNVRGLETQYLLGESLMVAPVLTPQVDMSETMSVYFPEGLWFDFWSKKKVVQSRGQWEEMPVPALDSMVCYTREGHERTWNEVGEVVKVELYGTKTRGGRGSETWESADGAGGKLVVVRESDGRWVCDRGSQVAVFRFDD